MSEMPLGSEAVCSFSKAGITSAVFSFSQCLTGIPWGRASDYFGRKPVILVGLSCTMTACVLFGFSRSLSWAIMARSLAGASSGTVGIIRTTVAEMVPEKSLQPRAFSVMPLVWSIGAIIGPVFGGALANPARGMPQFFGGSVFLREFPFVLPNLVAACLFMVGLISGFLFLKVESCSWILATLMARRKPCPAEKMTEMSVEFLVMHSHTVSRAEGGNIREHKAPMRPRRSWEPLRNILNQSLHLVTEKSFRINPT